MADLAQIRSLAQTLRARAEAIPPLEARLANLQKTKVALQELRAALEEARGPVRMLAAKRARVAQLRAQRDALARRRK